MAASPGVNAAEPDPAEVTAALKRSADWQLSNPSGIDTRFWVIAPLYDGLLRVAAATGDPKCLAAVLRFGTQQRERHLHWFRITTPPANPSFVLVQRVTWC